MVALRLAGCSVLAAAACALAVCAGFFVSALVTQDLSWSEATRSFGFALAVAAIAGLLALAHALVLGIPAFLLLRRAGRANAATMALMGFVVGCVPVMIMMLPTFAASPGLQHWFGLVGSYGLFGAIGALAFWFSWQGGEPGPKSAYANG